MNGIDGNRKTYRCPRCRKRFFFWRPDVLPGAKVKCYFCGMEFEDEAAQRTAAPTPPAAPDPNPPAPPAS